MANRVSHVLFDLDDTLCDFSSARLLGLERAFDGLDPSLRVRMVTEWTARTPALYAAFLRGELTLEQYRHRRFEDVLAAVLPSGSAVARNPARVAAMNAIFMTEINERIQPVEGAVAVVRRLVAAGHRCSVFTNGPGDGQRRKLAALGLSTLLEQVFASDELGLAKPDPRAYLRVAERLGLAPQEIVMVGDSLENDIVPARAVGMLTIHVGSSGVTTLSGLEQALARLTSSIALDAQS